MRRLTVLLLASLVACPGGGQRTDDPDQKLSGALEGIAFLDAPIAGRSVEVYDFQDGVEGERFGVTVTDENGHWGLDLGFLFGDFIVKIIPEDNAQALSAIVLAVEQGGGRTNIAVTPITHLAAAYTQFLISKGLRPLEAFEKGTRLLYAHFGGVDHSAVLPIQALTSDVDAELETQGLSDGLQIGILLAALSQGARNISEANGFTVDGPINMLRLIENFSEDIRADGVFDGKGEGANEMRLGGTLLSVDTLRVEYAVAIGTFLDGERNVTNLTSADFDELIGKIVNNRSEIFPPITPTPLDLEGPAIIKATVAEEDGTVVNSDLFRGDFFFLVEASDDTGVASIEVQVLNDQIGVVGPDQYPIVERALFPLESFALNEGDATVHILAKDIRGNVTEEDITLRIDNQEPELLRFAFLDSLNEEISSEIFLQGFVWAVVEAADENEIANITATITTIETDVLGADTGNVPHNARYPLDTTELPEGPHTIRALIQDSAGNVTIEEKNFVVDNDNSGPEILLAQALYLSGEPIEDNPARGDFSIRVETEDVNGVASIGVSILDEEAAALGEDEVESPETLSAKVKGGMLPDGIIKFRVIAFDSEGNATQHDFEVLIDNSLPSATEVGVLDETNQEIDGTSGIEGFVWLTLGGLDPNGIAQIQAELVDGAPGILSEDTDSEGGTARFGLDTTQLSEGTHVVRFTITDMAGNVFEFTQDVIADNDRTGPSILVARAQRLDESLIGASPIKGEFLVEVQASDPSDVASVSVSVVDHSGNALGADQDDSPDRVLIGVTGQLLPDGITTFRIIATDKDANVVETELEVLIDNGSPESSDVAFFDAANQEIDGNSGVEGSISLTVTGVDPNGIAQIQAELVDGAPGILSEDTDSQDHSARFELDTSQVSEGVHVVLFAIMDVAGNVFEFTQDVIVDNDRTGPVVVANEAQRINGASIGDIPIKGEFRFHVETADPLGVASATLNILRDDRVILLVDLDDSPSNVLAQVPEGVLADGTSALRLIARDNDENVSQNDFSVVIDNGPPSSTGVKFFDETNEEIDGTVGVQGSVWLTLTGVDPNGIAGIEAELIDASEGILSEDTDSQNDSARFGIDTIQLSEGVHVVQFTITDVAGNVFEFTQEVIVDNDRTGPAVIIAEAQRINGASIGDIPIKGEFRFHVETADPLGVAFLSVTIPEDETGALGADLDSSTQVMSARVHGDRLPDGSCAFRVVARDNDGNVTDESFSVVIDNGPPSSTGVKFFDETNEEIDGTTGVQGFIWLTLTGVDSHGIAGIEALLNGAADGVLGEDTDSQDDSARFGINTVQLSEGTHIVQFTITDIAGNVFEFNQDIIVDNDRTGPAIIKAEALRIDQTPIGSAPIKGPFLFHLRAGDPVGVASITVSIIDDGTAALGADEDPSSSGFLAQVAGEQLPNGLVSIRVTSRDNDGNVSQNDFSFTLDNENPVVTNVQFLDPEGEEIDIGTAVGGVFTVLLDSADANGIAQIQTELVNDSNGALGSDQDGSAEAIRQTIDSTQLQEGPHTIRFVIRDSAGNELTETRTLIVDNVSPDIEITTASAVNSSNMTFTGVIRDSNKLASIRVSVDGVPDLDGQEFDKDAPYVFSYPISVTCNQTANVQIVVRDVAGNVSQVTHQVSCDDIGPDILIKRSAYVPAINMTASYTAQRTLQYAGTAQDIIDNQTTWPVVFSKWTNRMDELAVPDLGLAANNLPSFKFSVTDTGKDPSTVTAEYRYLYDGNLVRNWAVPRRAPGESDYIIPISFQALGNQIGRLVLTKEHTIEIRMKDAVGNESTRSFPFTMDLRVPPALMYDCRVSDEFKSFGIGASNMHLAFERNELVAAQAKITWAHGLTSESLAPETFIPLDVPIPGMSAVFSRVRQSSDVGTSPIRIVPIDFANCVPGQHWAYAGIEHSQQGCRAGLVQANSTVRSTLGSTPYHIEHLATGQRLHVTQNGSTISDIGGRIVINGNREYLVRYIMTQPKMKWGNGPLFDWRLKSIRVPDGTFSNRYFIGEESFDQYYSNAGGPFNTYRDQRVTSKRYLGGFRLTVAPPTASSPSAFIHYESATCQGELVHESTSN